MVGVLTKYGSATWVQRGSGLVSSRAMQNLVDRRVDPESVWTAAQRSLTPRRAYERFRAASIAAMSIFFIPIIAS